MFQRFRSLKILVYLWHSEMVRVYLCVCVCVCVVRGRSPSIPSKAILGDTSQLVCGRSVGGTAAEHRPCKIEAQHLALLRGEALSSRRKSPLSIERAIIRARAVHSEGARAAERTPPEK